MMASFYSMRKLLWNVDRDDGCCDRLLKSASFFNLTVVDIASGVRAGQGYAAGDLLSPALPDLTMVLTTGALV